MDYAKISSSTYSNHLESRDMSELGIMDKSRYDDHELTKLWFCVKILNLILIHAEL